MEYAVIRFGGKQFKIRKGDIIDLEHQDEAQVDVLLYSNDSDIVIGEPICAGYEVILSKIQDYRGKKVRVARFKAKSRYNKVNTHRQPLSKFKVDYIGKSGGYKPEVKEKVVASTKVDKAEVKSDKKAKTVAQKELKSPKESKKAANEVKVIKKRGRPKKVK